LFPNHAELYVKYYKEAQVNMISRKTAQVLKIDGKAEKMLELFSSKSQIMVKKFDKVIRN
ncbi:MAG TPA: hypothetical protein PLD88_10375, partial [Candidatus Berkiella sp.]|nr:hypothetical protein [Candidatus Berkiella sp.]